MQLSKISFAPKPGEFKAALDEIIKFNNMTNEFNFVQEFYARCRSNLMPETKLGADPDWP